MKMKQKLEIETVEIKKVKLDVHFTYSPEYGFEIESIEDITGVQDLLPFLEVWVIEAIENKLRSLYESWGWL